MNSLKKIRVGFFGFLNLLPLYLNLLISESDEIELIKGNPVKLNNLFRKGELDITPVSSAFYPFIKEKSLVIPGFSLYCKGDVQSVILASKFPLEELKGKRIFLSRASFTSVIMLQIIMKNKGINFIKSNSKKEKDAFLSIGDSALFILNDPPEDYNFIYDLGRLWKETTEKGMVYAVFVSKPELEKHKVERVKELFTSSIKIFKEKPSLYIEKALNKIKKEKKALNRKFIKNYLFSLNYSLTRKEIEELLLFYNLANRFKLLPSCPELSFYE